jgi:uncharacterized protein YutE (UPF0331/DUF86 family)
MSLESYLALSKKRANEEKAILESLSKRNLSPIEIRAAKNSLQVLIENAIGKAKKILKYYHCPIIPQRSKDAFYILNEVGAIEEEEYRNLSAAIGFRNALIHDYLEFSDTILLDVLEKKKWISVYNFLQEDIVYENYIIKRIENFTF